MPFHPGFRSSFFISCFSRFCYFIMFRARSRFLCSGRGQNHSSPAGATASTMEKKAGLGFRLASKGRG